MRLANANRWGAALAASWLLAGTCLASSPAMDAIRAARERGELDEGKSAFYRLCAVAAPDRLPAHLRGDSAKAGAVSVPIERCGTPIVREATRSLPLMDLADRAEAEAILFPEPVAHPGGEATRTLGKTVFAHYASSSHETPNFSIEWESTLTNEDGTFPALDVDPANGVPDVIEFWADYFEQSYAVTVGNMGYTHPVLDQYKITVVVKELGDGTYGLTYSGAVPHIEVNQNLFFVPDNDDPNPIRGAMKVTASHEFFHVHHFLYEPAAWIPSEDDWWFEASSTWMEDEVFDQVNDYYQFYLGAAGWAYHLSKGLAVSFGDPYWTVRAYGGAVFPKYLQQHAGGAATVWEIWQEIRSGRRILYDGSAAYATDGGALSVVSSRLGFFGIEELYQGYAGANAVMDYDEGSHFGSPTIGTPIATSSAAKPLHFGAVYRWEPGGDDSLEVTQTTTPPAPWALALTVDREEGYNVVLSGSNSSGTTSERISLARATDAVYAASCNIAPASGYTLATSSPVPVAGIPTPPAGLETFPVAGGFLLSWSPDASAEGYVTALRKSGDPSWTYRTVHAPVSSIEFSGLDTASLYDISVFTYDAYGNEGGASSLTSLPPGAGNAFSPSALSFGIVTIPESETASLTIENLRSEPFTLGPIEIAGSQDFTTVCGIVTPCCLDAPDLLPEAQCGLDISFIPSVVGTQKGTITAKDASGGNIGFATLVGQGFSASPPPSGGGGGGGCFLETLGR